MVPFLTLENITVVYSSNEVLRSLTLQINEGEQWAIIGESGSGKTTLLETIAGKHAVRKGEIHHHFYQRFLKTHDISDPYFNYKRLLAAVWLQHNFRNRYNLSEFYYQQRFNSADADEAVSVRDYLADLSEEGQSELSEEGQSDPSIIKDLHLEGLLDKSLIKLSNGETRRMMFAAALMKHPQLLLLDAPFTGLDAATRPYFHQLINRLIASGLTVIISTSQDEIPEGITHVLRLEKGRGAGTWTRAEFEVSGRRGLATRGKKETAGRKAQKKRSESGDPGSETGGALHEPESALHEPERLLLEKLLADSAPATFEYALRMRDVSVSYGDTPVLQQINWEVKKGERWALSGHNGAGKSTLLSLINADNPQAYANDLLLFDRRRGSGESIWDIKKNIGYVSPELHQYFKTADNCLQVVLSGLFDTLGLIRKVSPEQEEQACSWLKIVGVSGHEDKPFRRSPLSIQRLVLIARALIKNPPLLILDEPCQGMDAGQIQRIRFLIDSVCRISGTTLIYVSHYTAEIPSSVDKLLRLEQGKATYNGVFPT